MEPTKYPRCQDDARFSKWLESVRKDVEWFFGRLKGRFRILKLPILFRKKKDINNIFFTCCILHNMLHSFDGLGELESEVEWEGFDGLHHPWIADPLMDVTSVGLSKGGPDEVADVEADHDDFRRMLLES